MSTPERKRSLRSLVRDVLAQAGEAGRLFALLVADGAARVLPRAWAIAVCDVLAWLMMVTPLGWRVQRRMARTFPSADARAIAHDWFMRSLRDHVVVTRIVIGRERIDPEKITVIGSPPAFGRNDQSLIIATGHFSREAMIALYHPSLASRLIGVVAQLDFGALTPKGIRLRLQFGRIKAAALRLRKGADMEFLEVGAASTMMRLARRLRQPGNFAIISADVPWTHAPRADRYERPFAGRGHQSFALGSARLARLGQCPIVTCVPFLTEEGGLAIEWGEPIPPPSKDELAGDARVMDEILDRLERAVGRLPGQYVIPIGHDRRWSAVEGRWIGEHDLLPAKAPWAAPEVAIGGQGEIPTLAAVNSALTARSH